MAATRGDSSSVAAKRIRKEINDLARENLGALKLFPNESNILQWRAMIPGPEGSAYEGGVFEVAIAIPDEYPFTPPQLQFVTKVYHCNIASTGAICLDILKTNWSPALSLYKVILSLSSLLTDPNPADPLVPAIAQEYKRNRAKHDATARAWVKKYALPKEAPAKEEVISAPPAPSRPTTTRPPRVPRRGSEEPSPVPQIAGRRRPAPGAGASGSGNAAANAIDLASDDDEIEVLGDSSNANGVNARAERQAKRARLRGQEQPPAGGSGEGSGDVIVIDD